MVFSDFLRSRLPKGLRAAIWSLLPPLGLGQILGTFNFWWFRRKVDSKKISSFAQRHAGDTVYILGAGPSLNKTNLKLAKAHPVIFCNLSVTLAPNWGEAEKYWIVADGLGMNKFRNFERAGLTASFRCIGAWPSWIKKGAVTRDDVVLPVSVKKGLFRVVDDHQETFSEDLSREICHGGGSSVIFMAIQLAIYMGARKVVLLGADFGVLDGEEPHFADSVTFPKERRWDAEDSRYQDRIRPALVRYLNASRSRGVLLINGSAQTKDDVLPRTLEFCL